MRRKRILPGWMRRGRLLLLGAGMALLASGCSLLSGGEQKSTDVPASTGIEQKVPDTHAGAKAAAPRSPLTGLAAGEGELPRPVMVMVNNFASARPQSGLTQADILLECLAEGDITRLVAIFHSRRFEEPIGPVRSIRPYFIDIGKSFHALQVHAGGSPDAYTMIQEESIEELDEITNAGPYFWRESFRKAPHNLYTNLPKLMDGAEKKGYLAAASVPTYSFYGSGSEVKAVSGTAAAHGPKVDITFLRSNYLVSYSYDAEQRLYMRSINGAKHIDLNNERQLSAANLVVMGTDHKVLDSEGRLEVRLTGSGPALMFGRGQVKQVEWKRERADDLIRFYENGKEVSFHAGQTHMMIVPMKPTFEGHVAY